MLGVRIVILLFKKQVVRTHRSSKSCKFENFLKIIFLFSLAIPINGVIQ